MSADICVEFSFTGLHSSVQTKVFFLAPLFVFKNLIKKILNFSRTWKQEGIMPHMRSEPFVRVCHCWCDSCFIFNFKKKTLSKISQFTCVTDSKLYLHLQMSVLTKPYRSESTLATTNLDQVFPWSVPGSSLLNTGIYKHDCEHSTDKSVCNLVANQDFSQKKATDRRILSWCPIFYTFSMLGVKKASSLFRSTTLEWGPK